MWKTWLAVTFVFFCFEPEFAHGNLATASLSSRGIAGLDMGTRNWTIAVHVIVFIAILIGLVMAAVQQLTIQNDWNIVFERLTPAVRAWPEWKDATVLKVAEEKGDHLVSQRVFAAVIRKHAANIGIHLSTADSLALAVLPPTHVREDTHRAYAILRRLGIKASQFTVKKLGVSEGDLQAIVEDIHRTRPRCRSETTDSMKSIVRYAVKSAGLKFPISPSVMDRLKDQLAAIRKLVKVQTPGDEQTSSGVEKSPKVVDKKDVEHPNMLSDLQLTDKGLHVMEECYLEPLIRVLDNLNQLRGTMVKRLADASYYEPLEVDNSIVEGMETPAIAIRMNNLMYEGKLPLLTLLLMGLALGLFMKVAFFDDDLLNDPRDSAACSLDHYRPASPFIAGVQPTSVTVTWPATQSCQDFVKRQFLYIEDQSGVQTTHDLAAGTTALTVTGLRPGTLYTAVLEAVTTAGHVMSLPSIFTTLQDPGAY